MRLLHLANMTSQLVDNIPDLTQVRMVPGEPLIRPPACACSRRYTRRSSCGSCICVTPRRPPGSDPAHSNVASMLLGVVLEKIYGEPFETILAREIEKPLQHGQWHGAARQTTGAGIHEGERGAAAILGADAMRVRLVALQHARICCAMRPGSWWNATRR